MSELAISVPCDACEGPIRFGDRVCSRCGKAVPKPLREALERRLESSSGDYRELRENVRAAAVTLYVLGGLHLVAALGLVILGGTVSDVSTETAVGVGWSGASTGVAGVAFLAAATAVARAPRAAIAVASGIWLAAVATSVAPTSALGCGGVVVWFGRVTVLAMLVRGALSAHRAHRARSTLTGT